MLIRLLPQQIPIFWEAIKQATTKADEISQENYQVYLNKLLHSLLNDKSQCFIRLSDKKVLTGITITKIIGDQMSGKNTLFIRTLYSWQIIDSQEWKDDFVFIRKFAEHEKCSTIEFESRHQRVHEIGKMLGFTEDTRRFSLGV